ncbi:hypothetical protein DCAR_0625982 [Daucus carota subsp. sativus]|uniref:NERD domain-containing protein n=1 Tax=Daucus carota subsp. sativus TaxID=79200 RepID=A0AAF0XGF3_DAUCS|nr:PREDICTED: uncharacterized protein LOC108192796 [Daucus carota subsp. sativus]WOH06554.1 hypothetical protein DCAR_0625982 [Daucus carota subsp. sativus]
MWVELLCGLVIYKIITRFFSEDDDDIAVGSSDSTALFTVADRLEKLYGGKAYVGLRIPDADTGTQKNVDIVLVTKREAVVVSVKRFGGFVSINADGSWVCVGGSKHKEERHPDPIAETKQQIAILESYLEQRGVSVPEGYFSCRVVCPNPKFSTLLSNFPPEVITYEQWIQMKKESKSMFSGWMKGAFNGGKKEIQEQLQQKLNFILSTAPMWDRLELKGKYFLGEFLDFKGKQEDIQALRNIKRSKVNRLIVQKTSMFGLAHSTLQVLYSPRDYRTEGASGSDWKEATVRSSTEVLFQPQNSSKVRKIKLSSIISMSLSA